MHLKQIAVPGQLFITEVEKLVLAIRAYTERFAMHVELIVKS